MSPCAKRSTTEAAGVPPLGDIDRAINQVSNRGAGGLEWSVLLPRSWCC